jgi:hypothetical protein
MNAYLVIVSLFGAGVPGYKVTALGPYPQTQCEQLAASSPRSVVPGVGERCIDASSVESAIASVSAGKCELLRTDHMPGIPDQSDYACPALSRAAYQFAASVQSASNPKAAPDKQLTGPEPPSRSSPSETSTEDPVMTYVIGFKFFMVSHAGAPTLDHFVAMAYGPLPVKAALRTVNAPDPPTAAEGYVWRVAPDLFPLGQRVSPLQAVQDSAVIQVQQMTGSPLASLNCTPLGSSVDEQGRTSASFNCASREAPTTPTRPASQAALPTAQLSPAQLAPKPDYTPLLTTIRNKGYRCDSITDVHHGDTYDGWHVTCGQDAYVVADVGGGQLMAQRD